MRRVLFWGGGPYHPLAAQAEWLANQVRGAGVSVDYIRDHCSAFQVNRLQAVDLLVLGGFHWSGIGDVAADRDAWASEPESRDGRYRPLTPEMTDALIDYVAQGGAFLCHHGGIASFTEPDVLQPLRDGRWIWGQSAHQPHPLTPVQVDVIAREHPAVVGVDTTFTTVDEVYMRLEPPTACEVLLTARCEDRDWPVAWSGSFGLGRTMTSVLGHDMRAFESPAYAAFLLGTVRWLLRR